MRFVILGISLLSSIICLAQEPTPIEIYDSTNESYKIDGKTYNLKPGLYVINNKQYKLLKNTELNKDTIIPPAPKDVPSNESTEKQIGVKNQPITDEEVMKILKSGIVHDDVKNAIISNIEEPKEAKQREKPKFDLLKAMSDRNKSEIVKSFTDETPPPKTPPLPKELTQKEQPKNEDKQKSDFILLPLENGDQNGIAAPPTDIGITVGGKIDMTQGWDQNKPIPYGQLLQFWVKPVSRKPEKLKSVAYTWTVLPKDEVVIWPDTTRIIVSSGNKQLNMVVMLTASYVFLDGDKIIQKAAQAITVVQIGESQKPQLPQPPSLDGISKQSYEWVSVVVRSDEYKDEDIKVDAKKLAFSFTTIASKIDGAQLTNINDILAASKKENGKALGNKSNEWLPWFDKMTRMLENAYNNNTIKTPQEYSIVWKEIAKGLEAYSK